jgi:phospholipid/cholesterol/gamma-HCH transport system ATP-binding protein
MTASTSVGKAAPPIQLASLHKSFGRQTVLNGISLEVEEGETLSVLGKSGTGKSVLLKIIIGIQSPDSGSVRVHGTEITNLDCKPLNEIRKRIGFLFQNSALYDSLTVEQNVAFPLERHSAMSRGERKNRVRELLSNVGMEKHSDKMPGEISGGMQKRVGLARALALSPDILLFDEPTTGLDPITASEISALILELQNKQSITSIVVTHDLPVAQAISDRLAVMRDGRILIEGSFRDLKESNDQFVAHFLSGTH